MNKDDAKLAQDVARLEMVYRVLAETLYEDALHLAERAGLRAEEPLPVEVKSCR